MAQQKVVVHKLQGTRRREVSQPTEDFFWESMCYLVFVSVSFNIVHLIGELFNFQLFNFNCSFFRKIFVIDAVVFLKMGSQVSVVNDFRFDVIC